MIKRMIMLSVLISMIIVLPLRSNTIVYDFFQEENPESDLRTHIIGKYKGNYQHQNIVFDFIKQNSSYPIQTELECPRGSIYYSGKSYDFECFTTESKWKYEVRIKRPNNPAILGEYLEWRAQIEVNHIGNLKLTVYKDLSIIEGLKYTLPKRGAVIMLNSADIGKKTYFARSTTFSGKTDDFWETTTYYPNGRFTTYAAILVEGWWHRVNFDGHYYLQNMTIHIVEDGVVKYKYKLINNGTKYKTEDLVYERQ